MSPPTCRSCYVGVWQALWARAVRHRVLFSHSSRPCNSRVVVAVLFVMPATYPLDVARRRMQTETFILNNLMAKGWSSTDCGHSTHVHHTNTNAGVKPIVEHSGDSVFRIWRCVVQREGVRGLFKVTGGTE